MENEESSIKEKYYNFMNDQVIFSLIETCLLLKGMEKPKRKPELKKILSEANLNILEFRKMNKYDYKNNF
jgi:hypothetical protein